MPTQSIIAACQAKFAALDSGNFPGGVLPKLYFDEAPVTGPAGAQLQVTTQGYVVLKDNGQDVTHLTFGRNTSTRETARFDFEVYYPTLASVDAAVLAIKRNGQSPAGAGFDFGTLSDLESPRSTFVIRRQSEQRSMVGLGQTGARVHMCRISYAVEILETA